jgi:hypothetical protein
MVKAYAVEYVTADGTTHTTTAHARTATDAVATMTGRFTWEDSPVAPEWRLTTARLHVSQSRRRRAAWVVARDQAEGADEPMTVREACAYARDILRLPEDPYIPGAFPMTEYGDWSSEAYRIILESTDDELLAAIPEGDSVRPRPMPEPNHN